jgi:hypothetical protein
MAPIAAPTQQHAAARMNDSSRLAVHGEAGTQEGHMYERHEEPNAGFAAGLITGAIVGAGLALLLAPKSGAALRDELGESWISLREAVGRRYRELAEHAASSWTTCKNASIRQRCGGVERNQARRGGRA